MHQNDNLQGEKDGIWGENATLTGIKNNVSGARILATGEEVAHEKTDDGKLFLKGLPQNPPDPYNTVIALELEGKPEVFDYSEIALWDIPLSSLEEYYLNNLAKNMTKTHFLLGHTS